MLRGQFGSDVRSQPFRTKLPDEGRAQKTHFRSIVRHPESEIETSSPSAMFAPPISKAVRNRCDNLFNEVDQHERNCPRFHDSIGNSLARGSE